MSERVPIPHAGMTPGFSKKASDDSGQTWTHFSGTRESHDVQAEKMNSKDNDGVHKWYKPGSGEMGQTTSAERERDWNR